MTDEERFWLRVDKSGDCWELKSGFLSKPKFWIKGRCIGIQRVAWEFTFGKVEGEVAIVRSCRNLKCVNPEHLIKIDHKSPGRPTRLTSEQVIETRNKYATGIYTQKELAKRYTVGVGTISKLLVGDTWKHVGGPRKQKGRKSGRKTGYKPDTPEIPSYLKWFYDNLGDT